MSRESDISSDYRSVVHRLQVDAHRLARTVVPRRLRRLLMRELVSNRFARHLVPKMNSRRAGAELDPRHFDAFYESEPDPYHLAGSTYELRKYNHELEALGDRHFGRALEVGCSIGLFTEMLAPRCDDLLAVDISSVATGRTSERVAHLPQVHVERRTLPTEMPAGPFNLIVCADVLYFWPLDLLSDALERFVDMLAPGGSFLAQHYRPDAGAVLTGDIVHDLLAEHLHLSHAFMATSSDYRLDRYDKDLIDKDLIDI